MNDPQETRMEVGAPAAPVRRRLVTAMALAGAATGVGSLLAAPSPAAAQAEARRAAYHDFDHDGANGHIVFLDPVRSAHPRRPVEGGSGERDVRGNSRQAQFRIPRKVVKGGSHLCAPRYCFRYRPVARQPQEIDTGISHLGFQAVVRPYPEAELAP